MTLSENTDWLLQLWLALSLFVNLRLSEALLGLEKWIICLCDWIKHITNAYNCRWICIFIQSLHALSIRRSELTLRRSCTTGWPHSALWFTFPRFSWLESKWILNLAGEISIVPTLISSCFHILKTEFIIDRLSLTLTFVNNHDRTLTITAHRALMISVQIVSGLSLYIHISWWVLRVIQLHFYWLIQIWNGLFMYSDFACAVLEFLIFLFHCRRVIQSLLWTMLVFVCKLWLCLAFFITFSSHWGYSFFLITILKHLLWSVKAMCGFILSLILLR